MDIKAKTSSLFLSIFFLFSSEIQAAGGLMSKDNIYVGAGLSQMSLENDISNESFDTKALTFISGYQFNKNIAVEARFSTDITDVEYDGGISGNPDINDYSASFRNLGIYLKPTFGKNKLNVYGLLGVGELSLSNIPQGPGSADRSESGLQWGLGANFKLKKNLSIFADYTKLYDDKGFDGRAQGSDISADSWNIGLSYQF